MEALKTLLFHTELDNSLKCPFKQLIGANNKKKKKLVLNEIKIKMREENKSLLYLRETIQSEN